VLTSDLLSASLRRGEVFPHYIRTDEPASLELARRLIEIFEQHRGRSRASLQEELEGYLGTGTEFLLHRGLAKLLFDRCEFDCAAEVDPAEVRRVVFEEAASAHTEASLGPFDRSAVLEKVRARLGVHTEQVETALYADLKGEQLLAKFETITSQKLLQRYNVALAQALLLRATELHVEISGQSPRRYRELFRSIKFFQLLHTTEKTAGDGYRIRLDGPLSLFASSQKYGLQMASFLPTLLNFDHWKLEAEVLWGKRRARCLFRLSPETGLVSHRNLRGQWQPEEVAWLLTQFPKLESDWDISGETELIDLGGCAVMAPDYVFTHRRTGNKVYMEIFGFWRRGSLQSRIEILRKHGPSNLLLALSRELHVGEEELADLPGDVYLFRRQPVAREVLRRLENFL
jgi:predicted nuclease of restriction endonuclease-like RecB superfamily